MSEEWSIRKAIVEACRRMNALGINQGTSGNISVRWRDGLLISPSGVDYAEMRRRTTWSSWATTEAIKAR